MKEGQGQDPRHKGYALRRYGPVPELPRVIPSTRESKVKGTQQKKRVRWADQAGQDDTVNSDIQNSQTGSDSQILLLQVLDPETEIDETLPLEGRMKATSGSFDPNVKFMTLDSPSDCGSTDVIEPNRQKLLLSSYQPGKNLKEKLLAQRLLSFALGLE